MIINKLHQNIKFYWDSRHQCIKKGFSNAAVIINKNVEEGLNIPLIDEGCTFYSYRHSYAVSYMRSGGSPLALATLMGRSVNTLATYVQELSEENDLVDAVSVMQ